MLESENWEKLLKTVGFDSVYTCPIDEVERKYVKNFLFLCSSKQATDDSKHCVQGWWESDIDLYDPVKYNEVEEEETKTRASMFTSEQQVYEKLHKIWSEVLGIDKLAFDDSFSACGGESLLAIQMMNHVRKELGYQLEIADTYCYPTLGTLAAYIAKGLGVSGSSINPIATTSASVQIHSDLPHHSKVKTLLMFPGQGAQKKGMFRTMKDSPEAQEVFKRAEAILGYNIFDLCASSDGEAQDCKLNSTEFIQVALFTGCIAKMEQIKKERPDLINQITHVVGLSVGEFAALVFAGVIKFEDALQLVQWQGRAMESEVGNSPTGMVSIVGPDVKQLQSYLSDHFPSMKISTFLGDNQHTVAGSSENCQDLMQSLSISENAEKLNISDVRRLRVAGAFHSSYMKNVAVKVNPSIQNTLFSKPIITTIMNVDGCITILPEDIKRSLQKQIIAPVNWKKSIITAYNLGIRHFVEVSPGQVLASIVKTGISECAGCKVEFIET